MADSSQYSISSDPPTDEELRRLNWPALVFPWIWCFFHRLYLLGCIAIVPIVTIFVGLYLLFNGNKLDWERNKERGAERFYRSRKRWNLVTAIIFVCLLGLGFIGIVYEQFTGGFSWKQYSFENGNLQVQLPFELKNDTPKSLDDIFEYGRSYQAGNERLNITISYTKLKAGHEFVLDEIAASSLETLRGAKGIKVISHKYEKLKFGSYPAVKMIVELVSDGTVYVTEYVYILAHNGCWYLCNTYPMVNIKSKEASDRVLNSVKLL